MSTPTLDSQVCADPASSGSTRLSAASSPVPESSPDSIQPSGDAAEPLRTDSPEGRGLDDLIPPDMIVSVLAEGESLSAFLPGVFGDRAANSTSQAPVRFKIRLANNEGQRSTASYLIEKMYAWRGYAASGPKPAPNRVTLVASDAEKALATITAGFDGPEGLVVDDVYHEEIQALRQTGARIFELTKLAVDRNDQSRDVLAMMFHVAYMYARRLRDCTHIVIEVNPRHVKFYQRMLGFNILGPERTCPRVGAPAVLLMLPLDYGERQIALYGGKRHLGNTVRSLYPYFFSPAEEDGIVGRLKAIG